MLKLIFTIRQIIDHYTDDEITVYAAQASFFTVISAIPFIMVLLTLIQLIPGVSKSDLINLIQDFVPPLLNSTVVSIIDDLFTKSPATVLSITAITAVWSASKGILGISRGLNRICACREKRGYLATRLICTLHTLAFLAACISSLILLVFGSAIQRFLLTLLPFWAGKSLYLLGFRGLFSLALLTMVFDGLFAFLPDKKLPLKGQLPGALFAALCWIGFSALFSIYFDHFQNFSYMYGSLTAIMLLMLWLYFCICILFFGAEINYWLTRSRLINTVG